jgi:O-antigen/teichoic acid export membrane protein
MERVKLKNALQSMFLSGLFIGIINLLAQIYFARILGVSIISDYGLIVVVVGFVMLLMSFGFNHAVIGKGFTSSRFQNCLILTFLQIGLMALVLIICVIILEKIYPEVLARLWRPALLVIVGFLVLPPAHAFNTEIECNLEYGRLAFIRSVTFLGANIIAALLCYFHPGLYVLPFRDCFNGMFYLFLSYVFLKQKLNLHFDKEIIAELIHYTKKNWLMNLTLQGGKKIDFALVGFMLNPILFGIYFQIRNLVEGVLGFLLNPIQSALFSYFRQQRDRLDFPHLAIILLLLAVVIGGIGVLILHFYGSVILVFLLGEEWREGAVILVPLGIYAVIAVYSEVLASMSKAIDRMQPIILGRIVNIIFIILLVPILTKYFGMNGAVWGTVIATSLMMVISIVIYSFNLDSISK